MCVFYCAQRPHQLARPLPCPVNVKENDHASYAIMAEIRVGVERVEAHRLILSEDKLLDVFRYLLPFHHRRARLVVHYLHHPAPPCGGAALRLIRQREFLPHHDEIVGPKVRVVAVLESHEVLPFDVLGERAVLPPHVAHGVRAEDNHELPLPLRLLPPAGAIAAIATCGAPLLVLPVLLGAREQAPVPDAPVGVAKLVKPQADNICGRHVDGRGEVCVLLFTAGGYGHQPPHLERARLDLADHPPLVVALRSG